MNNPEVFRPKTTAEIDDMVARNPLALVISADGINIQASPLPLVLQRNEDGSAVFIGHFSMHNPQLEIIRKNPRALLAFTGVQGYISSAWLSDRRYAPTWNYEVAHFEVDIVLDEEPGAAMRALNTLVSQMDANEPEPWKTTESPRAEQLSKYIVPFHANVISTTAQFKLGQGDPAQLIQDSVKALHRTGNHGLADAMSKLHQPDT
ncbi:FMN-binding negative transcriptional regulator [Undibacterium sp. TS12]|uniref:FMN-binding negative transcriptional regulator n=1 Tax=Undibacterium sp. TS12 TaxID=2908202 RepID=UPI001F4D1999|nr:FMN-binding negative transcriptional regulator [Undibacterium sp. TS12]MCH8619604.1 FMN-binding negative transcriptional regulator [Undibacterium sp. TS12]